MNRLFFQVPTACLLVALAAPAPAGLFKKSKPSNTPTPANPLAGNASKQPDKELFDKAMVAMKKGRYDVARLDLQTLLNTYPESEYQMRAKLAVGDSWFREGGTAALTQAEGEYKDFITFFPNQPEAAEAQMRVADIYYMQMEKPDRDHTNADRAEQEYRTMIEQFPSSPLVPRAKQRLREVQEVLAERQYDVGVFYSSHENWPGTIARLETVTDRYPLFSHSDLALIDLGDAYAAEARYAQSLNINPKAKQELMKAYDDRAAAAYDRVVTQYSAAPHVEDARERLIALNRPIPDPTQQEMAQSEAEEQSRAPITLKDRAMFLVKHGPSTVSAVRVGEPTMVDTAQVIAPEVNQQNRELFTAALGGKPLPSLGGNTTPAAVEATNSAAPASGADSGTAPLQLESVPTVPAGGANGASIGASIVDQGEGSGSAAAPQGQTAPPGQAAPAGQTAPVAATPTAGATPTAAAAPGAPQNYGIAPVKPPDTTLPPVEKPAEAAAQVNDVHGNTAQVQTGTDAGVANGKKPKAPKYNSSDESSSKHKKKKGLDKINPF